MSAHTFLTKMAGIRSGMRRASSISKKKNCSLVLAAMKHPLQGTVWRHVHVIRHLMSVTPPLLLATSRAHAKVAAQVL